MIRIVYGWGDCDDGSWLQIAKSYSHTHTPPKKNPRRKTPPQNPDTLCFCNPCPNSTRAQPSSRHVWLLLLGFEQLGDLEMGLANTIQIQLAKEAWIFQLPSGQMWAEPLQRVNHRATCASSTNKQAVCVPPIPPMAAVGVGMLAIPKHCLSSWTRLKPAFLPMGWEREGLTAAGRESTHARRCRELAAKQREIAGADTGICRLQCLSARLSISKTKGKGRGDEETFSY